MMGSRLLLCGYYGLGNLGDEAVLEAMVSDLRAVLPQAEIVVLSANPTATAQEYRVLSVQRKDWRRVRQEIIACDLFISGGGTLFQDATSLRSLLYYGALLWFAQRRRRRTMIYAQGLGPLRTRVGRAVTRYLLSRVDVLSLRDTLSAARIGELRVPAQRVELVADPAFTLTPAEGPTAFELYAPEFATVQDKIAVALRPAPEAPGPRWWAAVLDRFCEQVGGSLLLLPMDPARDARLAAEIGERLKARQWIVRQRLSPCGCRRLIEKCDFLVGMRLHALILAATAGVALAGFNYDPKVEGLLTDLGREEALLSLKLSEEQTVDRLTSLWQNRTAQREALLSRCDAIAPLARRPAELAAQLLQT